jgi:Protein of unknown function (DUF2800)
MTKHSAMVGGSTAGRLLNCPASFQATLALPASANIPSEFAEEGSAMHEVMAVIMNHRLLHPRSNMFKFAEKLIGKHFYDRDLTAEHYSTMVLPALEQLVFLEAEYAETGGGFTVLGVEKQVEFPGIPGAFGTIDLILGSTSTVLHVDWKFGAGVGVGATYKVDDGEIVNPQLMFYTAGAKNSARHFYKGRPNIVVAIIQPRNEAMPLSHVQISNKELKWFGEDLRAAVAEATARDPRRTKGEHCRWAPCKVSCPEWTGPLLDLSALEPTVKPRTEMVAKEVTPYGIYLARAKALADIVAMYKKEVDEQLHAYLEDGGTVPGWRLKAKAKQRKWLDDENEVAAHLMQLGFEDDEIWKRELVTFKAADATAKKLGVEIPEHLRVAPATNETTIAPVDDPAPVVERALAIEQFRASLKLLEAEKK